MQFGMQKPTKVSNHFLMLVGTGHRTKAFRFEGPNPQKLLPSLLTGPKKGLKKEKNVLAELEYRNLDQNL